jgi:hypothetical protein
VLGHGPALPEIELRFRGFGHCNARIQMRHWLALETQIATSDTQSSDGVN